MCLQHLVCKWFAHSVIPGSQEVRAAAMMNEVVELQREKDLVVGRLRRMEKTLSGMLGQ